MSNSENTMEIKYGRKIKTKQQAVILGRIIGRFSGWDEIELNSFILYDFEPVDGLDIPKGDISIMYDSGKFSQWDEDGKIWEADIIETLAAVELEKSDGPTPE